jgi:hypothetical protein
LSINDSTLMNNLSLANSTMYSVAYGGGVHNESGILTVRRSSLVNNRAEAEADTLAFASGGGISNRGGALTVEDGTISGNEASGSALEDVGSGTGSAIFSYHSAGEVTVFLSNSTVTGNISSSTGPPGYVAAIVAHGSWSITHCTIFGNLGGKGIHIDEAHDSVTMRNSIVDDMYGTLASSGYNLVKDPEQDNGFDRHTDQLGVDPLLGPLQDNGGPTQTMALLPGSPAIDAGDPNPTDPPMWDQRGPGFPRIVNGRIDIGAYEVQATGVPTPVPYLVLLVTADWDDD